MARHIPSTERLIVALDYPSHQQARDLVETLGDSVKVY
jgi:orotidine-5'-phosphate decarboxylase